MKEKYWHFCLWYNAYATDAVARDWTGKEQESWGFGPCDVKLSWGSVNLYIIVMHMINVRLQKYMEIGSA